MYQRSAQGAGGSTDGAMCLILLGGYHSGGQADLPVLLLPLLCLLVQQQLEHPHLPHLLLWTRGHHRGKANAHTEIQVTWLVGV